MKISKIFIFTLLLFFLLGAISASDLNSTDITNTDNIKEIHVSTTGDDLNTGLSDSPYATIGKAITNVNESDKTTIYLSKGTFFTDNDVDFDIDFNHRIYGGDLKFIGLGINETIIDGQNSFRFAKIGQNTNITFNNITFINFKANNGGTLYSEGILTIDNCVFHNSYATDTRGGAIYVNENLSELYVQNSKFTSCSVNGNLNNNDKNDGGGAIFAKNVNCIRLENNSFVSPMLNGNLKGFALNIQNSKSQIKGNKFINITANQLSVDAGIYISSIINIDNILKNTFISDNEFISCVNPSDNFTVVYLENGKNLFKNNTFDDGGLFLSLYTSIDDLKFILLNNVSEFNNTNLNEGIDLLFRITDDMGNVVKVSSVTYINLISNDYNYTYTPTVNDDMRHVNVDNIPNSGNYNLTVTFLGADYFLTNINIHYDNNPIELWVSSEGFDGNDGTLISPFASIQHAINVGFEKSFDVIIHVMEGKYSGVDNVELNIANVGNLQIIGDSPNVIIDGESEHWFVYSETNLTLKNLKFINGYSNTNNLFSKGEIKFIPPNTYIDNRKGSIYLENCIVDNNNVDNNDIFLLKNCKFYNLTFINNNGDIYFSDSPITLANSYFENNTNSNGGVFYFNCEYNITITNCKFINNRANNGGVIYSNSYIELFTKNSYFESNSADEGGVIYTGLGGKVNSENDTFINNEAINYGVCGFNLDWQGNNPPIPNLNFVNDKFLNNHAKKAGVLIMQKGTMINSSFINNSADYGGAIVIIPNNYAGVSLDKINLDNLTFINNTAKFNGEDIYLTKDIKPIWYNNQELYFALPLNITFNNLTTTQVSDYLTVNVFGPCNSVIGGSKANFRLDNVDVGYGEIINGFSKFKYNGFRNGQFVLSGDVDNMIKTSSVTNGKVNVNLTDCILSKEIWVSNIGSDSKGNGSINNPFKTIKYAIEESTKNCLNITIHILSGTYAGELNTCFDISSSVNLTLIGETGTIIDGENINYFIKLFGSNNKIVVSNMVIKNMGSEVNTDAVSSISIDSHANLYLVNVTIVECKNLIKNNGNLVILDSFFSKNSGFINGGEILINNSYLNASLGSISGDIVIINNSVVKDILSNYGFELVTGNMCSIENTIISNDCDNTSLTQWGIGYENHYIKPALIIASNRVNMASVIIVNNYKSQFEFNEEPYNLKLFSVFGFSNYGQGERNVVCFNSSFSNFDYLWCVRTYDHVEFKFDGCVFNNISLIAQSQTLGEKSKFIISNSVFLNCNHIIDRHNRGDCDDPDCIFENNYWGSNDKPIVNFLNPGKSTSFEPKTWIVLNFVNGILKLQLTDGENTTNYDDGLPLSVNYASNNGVMVPVVTIDGKSYPVSFDGQNINVASAPLENPILKEIANNTVFADDLTLAHGDIANFTARFLYPWGDPLANANVTFTIEGRNYTALTDASGIANIEIAFDAGAYTVITLNPASGQTNINSIVVNRLQSVVSATNVNTVYNGGKYLVITLKDSKGIALAGRDVTVVLNSKEIKGKTDKNGQFKVSTNALAPKTYAATISFAGDANHLSSKAAATIKVTKATPKLTAKKATLKAKTKTKKYTITLKDNQNKAMKKVKVTLKVKGKTYKATTNAKGKATFKITKLTKKGKYAAKVKFAGNKNFKAVTKSVKLTVK